MPSKDPVQRFEDILENIILIEQFTSEMDLNAFLEDLKTRNATERCMERISEAAKNWANWPRSCVRLFRGPTCALWETSCATSTTELTPRACG